MSVRVNNQDKPQSPQITENKGKLGKFIVSKWDSCKHFVQNNKRPITVALIALAVAALVISVSFFATPVAGIAAVVSLAVLLPVALSKQPWSLRSPS